eukprot:gene4966-5207_t
MAAYKKSVDEIWKELNARPPPRSTTTGIPGFGIPGVQTHTRILPKTAQQTEQDVPVLSHSQQQQHLKLAGPLVASDPAAAAGVSSEQLQQYVASLQRTINCLADPDRATRKSAVLTLQAKLLKGDAATPKATPSMLQALLSGPLLQPLAALLADPLERCRLTALQLLLDAVPQIADAAFLLPGLIPQLVARMAVLPVQETSEEVRLAGLQLVHELIRKAAVKQLTPCVGDLCLLLARGLEDPFPDAKKASAAGLSALAEKTPAGALEEQSEQLLQAVVPNLSHQHSKVRLAVIAGLRDLVLSGLPAGMVQTSGMSCLQQLLPQLVQVMQPILADADRDPALRLGLLKLLDDLLEDQQTAGAFGGSHAALTLQALLLPPLVWRAGKSAAAVRFAAITALATFMAAKLAAPEVLLAAVEAQSGLLPLLVQTLDEDWYSDVRHTACYVMQLLLQQVGKQLNDEARRAIYPELLKRLDDSSNKVRIAACATLVAFVESAGSSYCSTNSGYLAAGVAIHMDDGDAQVAEAACQCFMLDFWDHSIGECAASTNRTLQDLLQQTALYPPRQGSLKDTSPPRCVHLVGGGRICLIQAVRGEQLVSSDPQKLGVLQLLHAAFAKPQDIFYIGVGRWYYLSCAYDQAAFTNSLEQLGQFYQADVPALGFRLMFIQLGFRLGFRLQAGLQADVPARSQATRSTWPNLLFSVAPQDHSCNAPPGWNNKLSFCPAVSRGNGTMLLGEQVQQAVYDILPRWFLVLQSETVVGAVLQSTC